MYAPLRLVLGRGNFLVFDRVGRSKWAAPGCYAEPLRVLIDLTAFFENYPTDDGLAALAGFEN